MSTDAQNHTATKSSHWLDAAAVLVTIGAGIYLLASKTAAPDSYLQTIAHGIGAYMIGKGLWMARSLHLQERLLDRF